jgi:hypothetical protein
MCAANGGHTGVVEALVGAVIDAADLKVCFCFKCYGLNERISFTKGRTALMRACKNSHIAVAEYLVLGGASIEIVDLVRIYFYREGLASYRNFVRWCRTVRTLSIICCSRSTERDLRLRSLRAPIGISCDGVRSGWSDPVPYRVPRVFVVPLITETQVLVVHVFY